MQYKVSADSLQVRGRFLTPTPPYPFTVSEPASCKRRGKHSSTHSSQLLSPLLMFKLSQLLGLDSWIFPYGQIRRNCWILVYLFCYFSGCFDGVRRSGVFLFHLLIMLHETCFSEQMSASKLSAFMQHLISPYAPLLHTLITKPVS